MTTNDINENESIQGHGHPPPPRGRVPQRELCAGRRGVAAQTYCGVVKERESDFSSTVSVITDTADDSCLRVGYNLAFSARRIVNFLRGGCLYVQVAFTLGPEDTREREYGVLWEGRAPS